MNIVVAGGTGFLGAALVHRLVRGGDSVVVLTRKPGGHGGRFPSGVTMAQWDGNSAGPWHSLVDGADGVINLAGESLAAGRWTESRKARLRGSRLNALGALRVAIGEARHRPAFLISASAVGYYGDVPQGDVTESTPPSDDFLGGLGRDWEAAAFAAAGLGVRVAVCRIGVVLGDDGGALSRMVLPFRFFVGGPLGSGRQWLSWVHRDDVIGAMLHIMRHVELFGPFNVTAPAPVRMSEFSREIGAVLHRPSWARVPAFALRILLGEMSAVVLTGQKVIPARLVESGYQFVHPVLGGALRDVLA